MDRSGNMTRLLDGLWLLAFGLASSAWCLTASPQLGATFDEPVYVEKGLERWRTGSHGALMRLGTMPLAVDLDTLPLYLWERSRGTPFHPLADLERLLPYARVGTLVFWWVLLYFGMRLGRDLAGPWGGRLAVALLACEPSLLAHATLATTDIAVSACLLAFVYHFRKGRAGDVPTPWWRRIGIPAFWFGLAVLSKASSLVFGPLCMLMIECERLLRGGFTLSPSECQVGWRGRLLHLVRLFAPLRKDAVQIVALGLVLVFVYCGSDWRSDPSFVAWAHRLPDGPGARAMIWFSEHLCIFSNAGHGLARQIVHNVKGHGVYLLGQTHPRALWYYFPVALTIKLTLPLLALPLVVACVRPRALMNAACLAAAGLLLFSLNCRVQIGIRLVLPLVGLAVVGLSAAAVTACRQIHSVQGRTVLAAGLGLAVAWALVASVAVWPHGLCYTNELWGGTARGYLRLSDSNYDWGQGLKELGRWRERHGVDRMDLWYYGSDPAARTGPFRMVPLHALPIDGPEGVAKWVPSRHLAVSTSLLYGMVADDDSLRRVADLLRQRRPVAQTTTFFIYDFTDTP